MENSGNRIFTITLLYTNSFLTGAWTVLSSGIGLLGSMFLKNSGKGLSSQYLNKLSEKLFFDLRWGVGKTNTVLVSVEFSAHCCVCHFLDI